MGVKLMMCKDESKNEWKKMETKDFYEMENFNNFSQKSFFFFFSQILDSKLTGISLDYELLII